MELLINIVTEHLKHHKRLVVPRLGAFLVKPDGRTVVFSEMLRNDDGVLHGLLTAAGLSELEADGLIDRMACDIRHAAASGKEYALDGLGTFSAGDNGTIRFICSRPGCVVKGFVKPYIPLDDRAVNRDAKLPITSLHARSDERPDMQMSRSHIADPDPCVRGLKYGKRAEKKRKGSVYIVSGAPRRRRRKKAAIVLTALLITAAAICYLLLRHGGGHTSRQQPAAPVERENATVMQADTTAADTTRLATVPMQPGQAASAMQHDAADEPSSNTQQNVAKRHGTPEPGAGAPAAARHYTTEQER